MIDTDLSAFERFWNLGFRRLIPIVPPSAEISENSSLYKRVGTKQDGRGKTPGVRGSNGLWYSFDWVPYEADEADIRRWAQMGAGVGIKTGNGLVAIDADTLNTEHAKTILETIERHFGRLPIRIGNHPKALYLARCSGPLKYMRVEFGTERVELLTEGRQFVASGVHPKTGKPYSWPRGETPFAKLPTFTPEQFVALLEDLRRALPEAKPLVSEGGTSTVSQEALRGDYETVKRAVEATPNTSALFPTREAYRDFGYAIKAALPDQPEEAFELFADWCARWTDGHNDPDVVAADWARMKPPYRRGASWLYELAGNTSNGSFSEAMAWFSPIEPNENPFTEIELNAFKENRETDTYRLIQIDELMSRPPPVFLVDRHIPERSVGFLYSEPGVGKSFLMLDLALHIAYGLPDWHGDALRADPQAVVIYLAAEGSYGLRNRIKAWLKHRNIENRSKRLLIIEQTVNFMAVDDIGKLQRTVRGVGLRPCLVVVDTVSRALPGADENLQKDMTVFVRACDALRDSFGCAVVGVHHAGKSGDMRGSTVLRGAGDFVFRLERKKGATVGELTCEKQKDAPDGWAEPYRFEPVALEDGESSLVVERAELSAGPDVVLTPGVASAVLGAMRAAWDSGGPWAKGAKSGERYAVRRMVADFGFKAAAAEETLGLWESSGLIGLEVADRRTKRAGYKVKADPESLVAGTDNSSDTGVFG